VRWLALSFFFAVLIVSGCDCTETLTGQDAGMNVCPDGKPRPVGRCQTDDECCSREKCNVSTGICFALDACDDMRPCPTEQICRDENGDGYNECVFERCDDVSDCTLLMCPPDQVKACISGGCQCGDPCQGGCLTGQGCCVPEDRCYPLPEACLGLTCPPGQFVDITTPGAWDTQQCMVVGEACKCEILPPLGFGDIGLYSALAYDDAGGLMSAYSLDYGDLMFGEVANDGTIAWTFIDGLSTSTVVTHDINGPRGGISDPGPDVGIHTDIAVDENGNVHIAYQDRDKAALKYARGGKGRPFSSHTIEGEGRGDTGLFASIALDAQDRPVIAYLSARENANNGQPRSVLRLAFSSTAAPSAPANWSTRDIETFDLSGLGCFDRCEPGEVCRASDQACLVPTNNCTNCTADESCIAGTCTLIEPLPPYRDLPFARGLWPSLAFDERGDAIVAYHDRVEGNLKIARIGGPDFRVGAIEIVALDGNGVNGSMDISGLFPSLFITPAGEIHLSYMNQTQRSLIYRNLTPMFTTLIAEIVEEGLPTSGGPDGVLIGADSALVVDRTGVARIAYQDATNGELRYARRMGSTWNILTLAGNEMPYRGSFGFYSDQAVDRDRENPIVSTYRYFLSAPNGPDNGVEVFDGP
jgi:hypothetical protein